MSDVFPRRNLPDDADPWGRAHDDRVLSLETSIEVLNQSLLGQNRNSASSLETLADQVRAVEAAQTELRNQQASIIATQQFLSTQTVADSKSTLDQVTGAAGTITWYAFNPTYDCTVTVATGSAGKLLIQASATLVSSGLTSVLGIEIVGVLGPTYPGAFSTYMSATSASSSGVTRVVSATLTPNTSYVVRLRRGASGPSGTAMWRDQTLAVTRS